MPKTFENIYVINTAKEQSILDVAATERLSIPLLSGERWWHGMVQDGIHMPFGNRWFSLDLQDGLKGNQATPLLISNKGRGLWQEEAFAFTCNGEVLEVQASPESVRYFEGFYTLAGAYREAARRFFPASSTMPDLLNFAAPQYNTWIEMQYEPTQEKVIGYARQVLDQGLPAGVLMIDDNWFEGNGDWHFHSGRFPHPGAMVQQLHQWGFRLMLWISPFISPDRKVYRELAEQKLLVRDTDGYPVIRRWWNGQSAVLDVTNPVAVQWLHERLDHLITTYGVDGFKFDAGDPEFYQTEDVTFAPTDARGFCEAWARIGLKYPFNEYRACWKLAGQPLIQRLRDKRHAWGREGLADLIPNGLAQGLAGYAFNCPDMIGGGEISSFTREDFQLDQELFVRTMQCSALFPILQFSVAPWRVLDETHLHHCLKAVRLRQTLVPEIIALAHHAAQTGEPILRPMSYVFPDGGFEEIKDQFLLGDTILVAPVLEQGARCRTVHFPPGRWIAEDGSTVVGPGSHEVAAPLDCLPWYRQVP